MWLIVFASVVVLVLAIYAVLTFVYFRFAIRGRRINECKDREFYEKRGLGDFVDEIMDGREEFEKAEREVIETLSYDGLRLKAYRIRSGGNSKGIFIFFHGYRSSPMYDFSASYPFYSKLGYDMVFPFQRAHGMSEGKYITFGVKERKDVRAWIDFVNKENGAEKDIYLFGVSMGAATVLMGAGDGYPENVRGILADCGFTSPYEIVSLVADKIVRFGKRPLVWSLDKACKVFAGFGLKEYSTLYALKTAECPIIFFHGEADDFVPCDMTKRNYDAASGTKYIVTVPKAGHGVSYLYRKAEYEKAVEEFIDSTSGECDRNVLTNH